MHLFLSSEQIPSRYNIKRFLLNAIVKFILQLLKSAMFYIHPLAINSLQTNEQRNLQTNKQAISEHQMTWVRMPETSIDLLHLPIRNFQQWLKIEVSEWFLCRIPAQDFCEGILHRKSSESTKNNNLVVYLHRNYSLDTINSNQWRLPAQKTQFMRRNPAQNPYKRPVISTDLLLLVGFSLPTFLYSVI